MKELIIAKEDLLFNLKKIEKRVTKDNYTIIAVVKGNGYGLGIVPYTKFLSEHGIDFFAVASIEEVIELRNSGITKKLMILTPFVDKKDVEILVQNDITLTIDSYESAKLANIVAKEQNKTITAHVKIDTRIITFCISLFRSKTNKQYYKRM